MFQRVFALSVLFLLSSCASFGSLTISEANRPLLELQHIASKSLPLGLRKTSPNGREFFSNYFVAENRKFKPADKLPQRSYAHILVLGDRRPYTIQVIVRRERKISGGYNDEGTDTTLTKVIYARVQSQLNKRREDLNIIDDFRVF